MNKFVCVGGESKYGLYNIDNSYTEKKSLVALKSKFNLHCDLCRVTFNLCFLYNPPPAPVKTLTPEEAFQTHLLNEG